MPDQDDLARGEELARRGMQLADAGDQHGALPLMRDAVQCVRPLAAVDPAAEIRLAVFLHDLGLVLAWLGRPAEAVTPIAEAVAVYRRRLATGADPATIRFLLASSLDSLGTRLAALGHHRESLRATEESVAHYRKSATANRTLPVLELARALNNLSIRYADVEQHQEALAASRESVDLLRRVPVTDRHHLSSLAHATTNLALRLAKLEQHAEVPAVIDEAMKLIRRLPEPHPRSQLAALAESLTWLAWYLRTEGRVLRARSARRAAAALRRRLATER
ncbi:tetratricopeptide (TPR) repeat protein [Kitasatospora gansuensis]|uniref:Tetratricopeptide (TPR) repeat protein n=1 Tax=Kitasatospora gansuensis TaxID=258050 RepID=A0A7W7WLT0_9ACTN|nr:tetratricopeptide repeat protein [Kitasatospora gansuensis]MBB4951405.1 tetratricopeptide (TPR) repeat protein [Kitasatospora gansuensis]